MGDFSFTKSERLAKREEFQLVMNTGRRKRVENICTLFFIPNQLGRKRLGIIASKKVGNAVKRNRAKRALREIFRKIKNQNELAYDLVIISGKKLTSLPFSVLEQKISNAIPERL
ncbi:MAG: ribonuclease P protein component [Candidatus Nitrohelix vancouverensis]|uniref:Ribonuclease P protein component n=1 Tax=Candidatus Nitrohelix vancouverensis TaxID=2705534 RepID=A0A7T0C0S2_9BACT|nr:MAG: ribonuclease P protein component [Candidatus Nitrohelix vancouverensis]